MAVKKQMFAAAARNSVEASGDVTEVRKHRFVQIAYFYFPVTGKFLRYFMEQSLDPHRSHWYR